MLQQGVVVPHRHPQIRRQRVRKLQQADLGVEQASVIHQGQRHAAAQKAGQQAVGQPPVHRPQPRPDREHGCRGAAGPRGRRLFGDRHRITPQNDAAEEQGGGRRRRHLGGVDLPCGRDEPLRRLQPGVRRIDARQHAQGRDIRQIGARRRLRRRFGVVKRARSRQGRQIDRALQFPALQDHHSHIDRQGGADADQRAGGRRHDRHPAAPVSSQTGDQIAHSLRASHLRPH